MTLVLPVLVGVVGLVAIYGNRGLIADGLSVFGFSLPFNLYGLGGILLAHVFFNLPFSARLLLQSLEQIPAEQVQLANHLGIRGWHRFRLIEWPYMRQQLPHVAGLVFMLCFTSFATVMALGGGPGATTIELAIYQALRFDFDLQTGAILAVWQMLLCGALALVIQKWARPVATESSLKNTSGAHLPAALDSSTAKKWDTLWIALVCLLTLPPLLVVVIRGLNPQGLAILAHSELWYAVLSSMKVSIFATILALTLAVALLLASRFWRYNGLGGRADRIELVGSIILVTPGLVISTGLFLLLRPVADVFGMAFWLVTLVNALMALPYLIKILSQPLFQVAQQYTPLCTSLGIKGLNRLRIVEWSLVRKPLAQGVALAMVLSIGDLGAIALFGSQDFRTLPLYLYQLMGSYQLAASATVALLLMLLSLGLYWLIEKIMTRKVAC